MLVASGGLLRALKLIKGVSNMNKIGIVYYKKLRYKAVKKRVFLFDKLIFNDCLEKTFDTGKRDISADTKIIGEAIRWGCN